MPKIDFALNWVFEPVCNALLAHARTGAVARMVITQIGGVRLDIATVHTEDGRMVRLSMVHAPFGEGFTGEFRVIESAANITSMWELLGNSEVLHSRFRTSTPVVCMRALRQEEIEYVEIPPSHPRALSLFCLALGSYECGRTASPARKLLHARLDSFICATVNNLERVVGLI
jgi:hypothetical protein